MAAADGLAPRDRLTALGNAADGSVGLAEAALSLAALEHPWGAVDDYLAFRDALAGELGRSGAASAGERAAALADLMARRHRFRGDDQDDDETCNANLMWVIDHRRGVAAALGILYLEAARGAGWAAEALAFPSRLLVRLEDAGGGRAILDPFAGGGVVAPHELRLLLKEAAGGGAELAPHLWESLGNRDILVRLQNDVKVRLLRCGRMERALAVVEGVLLFAPDQAPLWREAGLMQLRLGRLKAAVASLEQFVARTDNGAARRRTLQLLQEVRGRLS